MKTSNYFYHEFMSIMLRLISVSGERMRADFFDKQRDAINTL